MSPTLSEAIREAALPGKLPDGEPFSGISGAAVLSLARRFEAPARVVEIAALTENVYPIRYIRNFRTFTPADQIRLLRARVAVIGLGGLGGTVAELLARAGVGRLTLVDGDGFEESNLNRQLLSTAEGAAAGEPKAAAAARRVAEINPAVEPTAHAVYLNPDNGAGLLEGAAAVVDCLDTIAARHTLGAAAAAAGIPLISAAVAGACGQVTTIVPGDEGLARIYGEADGPAAEAEAGCLGPAVAFLAALESAEVLKVLLGRGQLLQNRLLIADLMDASVEVIAL